MIREKIGLRIKELRKSKKLSQLQASLDANLNRTYWTDLECGKINISIINLKKICDFFGISLQDFFNSKIFDEKIND